MKTTNPEKNGKKSPPGTDTTERKLPPDEPAVKNYVSQKADWSVDLTEYRVTPESNRTK